MNKHFAIMVFTAGLSMAGAVRAADKADLPPPPPPPQIQSGETLQPEVNIIDRDGKRIEEYSVNGRVYAAKITPKGGVPYYLVDKDGDGLLETRENDLKGTPTIPQWIIFSW